MRNLFHSPGQQLLRTLLLPLVGLCASPLALAQGCTDTPVPLRSFAFADQAPISNDGSKVVLTARLDTAPLTTVQEVFLYNPFTGALTQLTRDTPATTNLRGTTDLRPLVPTAITGDGSKVFLSGSVGSSFSVLQPPGLPVGQYEELVGTPGRAEVLDVATGIRTPVGTLVSEPLQPGEVYTASISAVSSDGNQVLLNEAINTVVFFTANGVTRNYVPSKRLVAGGVLNLQTLQYTDIVSRIAAVTGAPGPLPGCSTGVCFLMSGDANAFAFDSVRRLEVAGGPLWNQVAGNVAQIRTAPYVYYLDQNVVRPIVTMDISAPRGVASTANFVRGIGQTGTVFGLDRGASYVGAPRNPSGANAPAVVRVGQPPEYVIGVPATIPVRGQFVNSLAFVSRDEQRIYFQSADDLVPGENATRSQELFSYEIATRRIRQISRLRDGLTSAFANDPATLQLLGAERQVVFQDASSDGRIVLYSGAGFLEFVAARRLPNGRINIVFPTLGSTEFPASEIFRIARCN